MPIMTRMRDNMPVILFGLLIAFLITIIFEWGMDYLGTRSGRAEVIGKINGKNISYREFSDVLKTYTDNQKAQSGAELDDNALRQARDQVWQSFVTQQVLDDQIRKFGITVTDQEIIEWVRGDKAPEDLRRNFVDSTGVFRQDLYDQFLANPNQFIQDPQGNDPNFGTKWLADYEKTLRQRRSQEKLQSIVLASVRVTEGELLGRYREQNQQYDASYAIFDANTLVKDDEVQVTDADLKGYFDENVEQYKVPASRAVKFVQFQELPSEDDSLSQKNEIEDVAQKARSGLDFIDLVFTYSEKPDSGTFFKHGELPPALENEVFSGRVGDIIGPVLDARGYHLAKILDERKSSTEYVHASHILLSLDGSADSNEVKAKAQSLAREAREGKDFAALAREHSKDPGSGQRGGDLGWFARGRMVKSFEDAAFGAKPGQIVGPIRSQFGLHIIKVHARDSRELKVATIVVPIAASSRTKNLIFDRSRDFSYTAKESEFGKEAQALGLEVRDAVLQEQGGVVPGLGVFENITRWAYSNKVGSVSDPFTVTNGYAVFVLTEAKSAGVRPFDEVKESLRPLVMRKKKIARATQIAAEVRGQLAQGDSLSKVSELKPEVRVQRTGSFTASATVPGIGRDLQFLGAVSALEVGQISQPVESQRGAYLIQLLAKSAIDSAAFASQKEALRNQMLQEKRNRFLTDWLEQLRADADIEDHRDLFFR